MVFRGAQTHRYGHASCSLLSTRSFPRDSAWLYCQALPFTSTDLGGIAGPRLEDVQTWTDSHGQKSFSVTRSRLSRIAPAPQPVARYRSDLLCTRLLPCRLDTVHLDHLNGDLMRVKMTSTTIQRPTLAPARLPRWPRTPPRPRPTLRRIAAPGHRPRPGGPLDEPCRTAGRSDRPAPAWRWCPVPLGVAGSCPELPTSRHSSDPSLVQTRLEPGLLPSPVVVLSTE